MPDGTYEDKTRELHEKAILAQINGDFLTAKKMHEENLQIRLNLDDKKGLSETYHHLGFVYHELGDVEEARKYYLESLKLCEEIGCKDGISSNLKRLGLMAHDTNNLGEALDYYLKCIKLKEEMEEKKSALDIIHRAGSVAYKLNRIQDALELYLKLFKLAVELDEKEFTGIALAQLHVIAIDKHKKFEGLMLLLCAHEIFMSIESNHFLATNDSIEKYKEMGYEDRISSIQSTLNLSSFDEIVNTAREALYQLEG